MTVINCLKKVTPEQLAEENSSLLEELKATRYQDRILDLRNFVAFCAWVEEAERCVNIIGISEDHLRSTWGI